MNNVLLPPLEVDEYIDIDMDVTSCSSTNFITYSIKSPPHQKLQNQNQTQTQQTQEFEFQMTSLPSSTYNNQMDSLSSSTMFPSPADELFYKGTLLPLHLPPRFKMLQKLIQENTNTSPNPTKITILSSPPRENDHHQLINSKNKTNLDHDCEVLKDILEKSSKKPWTRKMKQIKDSSTIIGQKIKASSRFYIKSLFSKSACNNSSSSSPSCTRSAFGRQPTNYFKMANKKNNPNHNHNSNSNKNTIGRNDDDGVNNIISHRKSFSGVIQRHCPTKCLSSSSSSSNSSSFGSGGSSFDFQCLKRSSSWSSETECSINGAIAHCKMSQQVITKNNESETGDFSLSDLKFAVSGHKDRLELCRI